MALFSAVKLWQMQLKYSRNATSSTQCIDFGMQRGPLLPALKLGQIFTKYPKSLQL